jgi:hypothetical protein
MAGSRLGAGPEEEMRTATSVRRMSRRAWPSNGPGATFFGKLVKTPGCCTEFTRMQRVLTLLLVLLCLSTDSRADQWVSDQYRCVLTMPDGESWSRRSPQSLTTGEMLFSANYKPLEQNVGVIVVPNIPSGNLKNVGIISRIIDVVTSLGFAESSHTQITFNDEPYLEVIGRRDEGLGPRVVCVARATLRDDTIYIVFTSGNGGEERAKDKHFLRVLNTFQIVESTVKKSDPAKHPLFNYYRLAYKASWAGAVGLIGLGLIVVIFSRRRA